MSNEEAQKVLDEMQDVRPEKLNKEAKRLFEAIMKIATERDKLKKRAEEQDIMIDLMAEQLAGLAIFDIDKDETLILGDKEEVEQYFENKAKEVK